MVDRPIHHRRRLMDGLNQLQLRVWQDADLQAKLSHCTDERELAEAVAQLAARHAIPLTIADLRDALSRTRPSVVAEDETLALERWIPTRLIGDPPAIVEWCRVDNHPFTDPFFEQTVRRVAAEPFNRLFRLQTPIATLTTHARRHAPVAPAGFIFHLSRCGSTLAAQLLAAVPRHRVLSEAEPIDSILRADLSEQAKIEHLRDWITSVAQPFQVEPPCLFIKFDSWQVLDLPLLRRAFPSVPWLFLYRHPLEILVSHRRSRGSQMVPGLLPTARFGLTREQAVALPWEAYAVQVLAQLCESALAYQGEGKALSYERLCAEGGTALLEAFDVPYENATVMQMHAVMGRHAKEPTRPFTADSAAKRAAATDLDRALCDDHLAPLMAQVEAWERRIEA